MGIVKVLLCFLFLLSALPSFAQPKIGVLDMNKLFENYYLKLEIERDVASRIDALKNSSRVQAVQETDAKLKELAATVRDRKLAAETRELAAKEFNSLALEHQSLVQEMEQYLSDEKQKATLELVETLEEIIVTVREEVAVISKEGGYDFVLETGGMTSSRISPIIYLKEKTDLTDLVIERLNKDAPSQDSEEEEAAEPAAPESESAVSE